ncbi:GCN5-related N-acetyltransferase [Cellulomonas flavigena DSM 20109]|uniref:GCN5-related N-acetyltransferase n=1 Tax=Cellulomonas flavigena (strain ATCC 482 / DSM 20109 / BCRC 11376 / JCM 18109 / NBRC 3775 / NCIMB 8073 / NRS 134) TaxID=446466 RepID=D5UEP7_CELFN|nr:GNAT family N-acetyltransferase [Cellulomonas flavigena]ADG74707.1 GCN5-related N-acetyltransferase [Cellulomonas flavigena DSM 20109]
MAGLLGLLPAALTTRRYVMDGRDRWADAAVLATGDASAVLTTPMPGGSLVWALGRPDELEVLLPGALVAHGPGVRWATVPRAVRVPEPVLEAAGLAHLTSWDRLSADVAPVAQPGEDVVAPLDLVVAEQDVLACLVAANPASRARPGAPDDLGWWGVRDGARLVGVVGTAARPDGAVFLHGLGVVASHRGRGLGRALTAAVTRRALNDGAPWVSLHMYADNVPARRLYDALGFRVDVENAGYGPPGLPPPG